MSLRSPTRLLPVEKLAEAYPLELLADFLTGDFTLITEDGKTVTHRTPGALEVKYGASSSKLNLADKDNVLDYPIYKLTVGNTTKTIDEKTTVDATTGHVLQTWSLAEIGALPLTGGTISGPIIPSADKVVDLGSESMAFRNIYGASFSGNAATASKLEKEIEIRIGNTIKKFDGSSPIVWELTDIGVMSSEGGEFTGDILPANNTINIGSEEKHFNIVYGDTFTGNAATATKLQNPISISIGNKTIETWDGTEDLEFILSDIGALPAAGGTLSGRVIPNQDNTVALGMENLRFSHIYANNFWGTAEKASKLAQARQLTIGSATKAIDWSTAVTFSLEEMGIMPATTTNIESATKLQTARTIGLSGVSSTPVEFDGTTNISIPVTAIPATLITGVLDISNIPASAVERMHVVADSTARFALTTDQVQTGDTVKETDTELMYYVKDDTKLDSEEGYEVYKAGTAASVDWSGVQNKPTIYQPSTTAPTTVGSTSAVGTGTTFARADHQHELAASGVTAGTYGPPSADSVDFGSYIDVPTIAVDKYGRITLASSSRIMLPSPVTMKGATTTAAGSGGYVPSPDAGEANRYLRSDGLWAEVPVMVGYVSGSSDPSTPGLVPAFTGSTTVPSAYALSPAGTWISVRSVDQFPITTNAEYPVLFSRTAYSTTSRAGTAGYNTMTYNPSTNVLTVPGGVAGNATTATTLQTARNLQIGLTSKSFNGSANVTWTLAEIGALPLTGGTMTGKLTMQTAGNVSGIAVYYSATLSTTWSGTAAPYTQAVTVSGLLATDKPVVDVVCSGTYSTDNTRTQQFCQIYRYVVAANTLTAYAKTKPTVSIPIQIMVVR